MPKPDAPEYWEHACQELSSRDERIKEIIDRHREEYLRSSGDPYLTLHRAVVGQQISVTVASRISEQIERCCEQDISPLKISRTSPEALRNCGLSWRKVEYLQGIASYFVKIGNDPEYWQTKDLEKIRQELLSLRGIGMWSFNMFAIFFLRHPDILPLGDNGLVRAMRKLYSCAPGTPEQLGNIAATWIPWRTVATWYLWRSLDGEAINY